MYKRIKYREHSWLHILIHTHKHFLVVYKRYIGKNNPNQTPSVSKCNWNGWIFFFSRTFPHKIFRSFYIKPPNFFFCTIKNWLNNELLQHKLHSFGLLPPRFVRTLRTIRQRVVRKVEELRGGISVRRLRPMWPMCGSCRLWNRILRRRNKQLFLRGRRLLPRIPAKQQLFC